MEIQVLGVLSSSSRLPGAILSDVRLRSFTGYLH